MEQEYLGDYIKLSQNIQTPKNGRSKEERVVTTTEKKKECENRAIAIVELLLEGSVRPETFLKSIMYLNSTYYQDMVEERAITRACGYPLCGKKIKTVTNKRYSISTKNNKVYDLDEYGYFCSIFCFNASNHVKNQIDDSPLWLRDFEDAPSFTLLQKNEGCLSGGVNLKSKIIPENTGQFIPVASFAEISLKDFIHLEDTMNNKSKKFKLQTVVETEEVCGSKGQDLEKAKQKLETVIEDDVQEEIELKENINKIKNSQLSEHSLMTKIIKNIPLEESRETTIEQEKRSLSEVTFAQPTKQVESNCETKSREYVSYENSNTVKKNLTMMSSNLEKLYCCEENYNIPKKSPNLKDLNDKIKNKFTKPNMKIIDPLPLKTGNSAVEKSIKRNFYEKIGLKDVSSLKLHFSHKNSSEIENQISNSVRKWISLDTLMFIHGEKRIKEILDEKKLTEYFVKLEVSQLEVTQQQRYIDICKRLQLQEILEHKKDSIFTNSNKLQPLPDYRDLKKEKKELDIKIKHFLGGMLYEADDSNFPMKDTKEKEGEGVPAVLPLVDVNSQNALRRRVLLGALNKGVKFFLDIVKNYSVSVFSDLQDLVKTFRLTANNVVFKPIVLNYLGFICLKILALKDAHIKDLMRAREAVEYENLIFDLLPKKNEVIHSCLSLVEDVDGFIANYVISDM